MDPIEHKIRSSIYDHSAIVPDHIWSNIEKELPKKEYKLLPIVFFFGLTLALLLSFLFESNDIIANKQNSPTPKFQYIQSAEAPSSNTPTKFSNIQETIISNSNESLIYHKFKESKPTHLSGHFNNRNGTIKEKVSNQTNDPNITSIKQSPKGSHQTNGLDEKHPLSNPNSPLEKKSSYLSIQLIEQLPLNFLEIPSPIAKEPLLCPRSNNNNKAIRSIEFYGGPDYPLRMLSSAANESQQNYIDSRNTTEKSVLSFHGGVRFVQPITNDIAIKFGGEYAQITERFQLIDSGAVRVQTVIDSIFAPDGTLLDIQTTTITENGIRAVNNYNELKSITIPITLGYYHQWNNTTAYVHLGAQFTIVSSYNGKILSPQLSTVLIGSDPMATLQPFKDNFGINLIGSIGILQPMSDRWSYFIEPNFRYTLNPITRTGYPLNQKFLTLGLSTGLNYKF